MGEVDADSVAFGAARPLHCRETDANDDGATDLICDFPAQDVIAVEASAKTFLTARTYDGQLVVGVNSFDALPRACIKQGAKRK